MVMVDYSAEIHEKCLPFLEEREARLLLAACQEVDIVSGAQLYKKGDEAACVYFLISGRIAVQQNTGFADRVQVVALLDPGAPIGETGLQRGRTRGATVVAVTQSKLIKLSSDLLEGITVEEPQLVVKLLHWLLERTSLRLRKNSERLAHVL